MFLCIFRVSELVISIGSHCYALNRLVLALMWKCHRRHPRTAMLLMRTNGFLHCASWWRERRRRTRWTGSTRPTSTRKWKCSRLALPTRERLLKYSAFITPFILIFNKTTNFNTIHSGKFNKTVLRFTALPSRLTVTASLFRLMEAIRMSSRRSNEKYALQWC